MTVKIPLKAIPNQQLAVVLGDYNCILHVYQRGDFLYMDLTANGTRIRQGLICLVDVRLPNYDSPDFSGVLFFVDMQGRGGTPNYAELGARYILCYTDEEAG